MNLNHQDHETILAYFTAKHREAGYMGPCFISVERLVQLHLSHSIHVAGQAVAKMMGAQ